MFRLLFVQAILSVSIDYCNCKKYNRKINRIPQRGANLVTGTRRQYE